MTKAKKQVSKTTPIAQLQGLVLQLTQRLDQHSNILTDDGDAIMELRDAIMELREAICPKVAARLTALERTQAAFKLPGLVQREIAVNQQLAEMNGRLNRLEHQPQPAPKLTPDRPGQVTTVPITVAAYNRYIRIEAAVQHYLKVPTNGAMAALYEAVKT